MVFAGERYYNINRILLTTIGVWPYQKPIAFQKACIFCILVTFIFFQFATFFTRQSTFDYVIKQLSYILPAVIDFVMYAFFYFNPKVVMRLFEHIKTDWRTMESNKEIRILHKYTYDSYLVTWFLSFSLVIVGMGVIFFEFLPVVLDTVAPMNLSRPRKTQVEIELFLDEQQYFYVYLTHEIMVMTITFVTINATGSMLWMFLRHCSATQKIASNLLENVVTKDSLQISGCQKICVMQQRISYAVRMHRSSLEFSKNFLVALNNWLFVLVIVVVLSLSCNMFRLFNAATLIKEISEILICFSLVLGHFMMLFLSTFAGQEFIDHSAEMFNAAYKTMWYLAPLPIQKLLLFTMQRSLKTNQIVIGSIFVSSLEGFSKLVTTSLSYFTVIHSVY